MSRLEVPKLACLLRDESSLLAASRSRKLLHKSDKLSLPPGLSPPFSGVEANVCEELKTLLRLTDEFMEALDDTRRRKGDIGALSEL